MARVQAPKNRRKSARHRAKLKGKHTKARLQAAGQLRKRNGGRRLRR